MRQFTHRAVAWALRLGLVGLILLAALTTALRLALPLADGYRDQLTATLSARLGYPLQMATLTLRLAGWSPRLVLGEVVITCPKTGQEMLRLRALELDLDPLASLLAGQPRLASLTLVGAHLTVQRALDGQVSLVGLSALAPDDPNALAVFLREGRLNLADSEVLIIDDALDGAVVRLTRVRLRLHNDGAVHQLDLLANPVPEGTAAGATAADAIQLRVLADLRGEADDTRAWDGDLYLSLAGANLAALVPWTLLDADLAHSQEMRLETWSQLRQGALVESRNRLGMRGVTLRLPPSATLSLDRLDALVRVTPVTDGWRVQVAGLTLAVDGAAVADLGLDLALDADGRPRALELASAGLDLQALTRLLGAWPPLPTPPLPLDPALIADLNPRARVEQLAVRARLPVPGPPTWQVVALVRGLGLDRHAPWPGITGLDARLRADQDGGDLRLDSADFALDLRPIFDQTLHLDRLAGDLHWTRTPTGGWHLMSDALGLKNADLAAQARFALDLPGPTEAAQTGPVIDLQASLQDADAAQARRYLPVGELRPPLTQWLTRALVSGRVPRGDLVLQGPLKEFPFRDQQGRYELVLGVRDLVLDYHPGWPPLEGAAGELRFSGQGLAMRMDTGRIYGTTVTRGLASIPDLWNPHRLPIHAEGSGPFADTLKVLLDTPLAAHLGPLARALEVEGRAQLMLDLDVPLGRGENPLAVEGHLTWPGPASLGLKGTPVRLTGLSGDLGFTVDSVRADALHAQLWGRPATLSIGTPDPGDTATTQIRAHSRTPAAVLAARFPSPLWRLTTGELDWDLGVDLHNADLTAPALPIDYSLRSQLRGLALNLPAPLGKTAERARPLELTGTLVPGRNLTITGTIEPLAWNLALGLTPLRLERGRVTLGPASAAAPPGASGLVIDGTLDELKLPVWTDWWDRNAAGLGITAEPGANADATLMAGDRSADLRIARLDLGGPTLTAARVQATAAPDGWHLDLQSKELQGTLQLPDAGATGEPPPPWALDLERLDLKALLSVGPDADDTTPPTAAPAAPARRPPAVACRVRDLRWGEAGLGRLSLDLRPDPAGFGVSRLTLAGPGDTQVTGDAQWLASATGGRTQLNLNLKSADTGPLLRALDYSVLLSPATVDARLRLEWPGGLGTFALARATGRIELDVGPGRLLDVDPGVGRVLGFLNLGELRRRLSLDFTDLYEQGFVFERITGRIEVGGGQARLQTFAIDGPSGDLRVNGSADLRARTFDQTVTVEPSIGTSVALASGVAGGPVLGAAVYLVDRLTGGGFDRLASYQYRMTGPWAKPELTRLGWEPFARGARAGNGADPTAPAAQAGTGRNGDNAPDTPAATPSARPGRDNRFLE